MDKCIFCGECLVIGVNCPNDGSDVCDLCYDDITSIDGLGIDRNSDLIWDTGTIDDVQ